MYAGDAIPTRTTSSLQNKNHHSPPFFSMHTEISLTEARAKQSEAKMKLLAGVDPAEQKQAIKKAGGTGLPLPVAAAQPIASTPPSLC